MKIHFLPGDAIVETFKAADIDGEIAVCRECLVEGDVSGETVGDFWHNRALFIESTHGESQSNYLKNVTSEFEKLTSRASNDSLFLWFEYELFCQVNYWFTLSLLAGTTAEVFRVAPIVRSDADKWSGFGKLSAEDLEVCFASRVRLDAVDIERGGALWRAFRSNDADELRRLSDPESAAFPMIAETVEAAIAKDERPQSILREIIDEGTEGFEQTFDEFSKRAGVYGFGDSQVKRIIENM